MAELKHTEDSSASGVCKNCNNHIREKLVELMDEAAIICGKSNCNRCGYFDRLGCGTELTVDHLIANGVTVQEWISVEERLPEKDRSALVYFDSGNMAVGYWYDKDECISFWQIWTDDGWVSDADCEPIYWMPLPPAPKGE